MATKYRPISLTTDKISSFTYECAKTVAGNLCISPVLGQFQAMLMFQHNSQQHQGFLQPQKVITAARDHRIIEKGWWSLTRGFHKQRTPLHKSYLSSGPVSILLAAYFGSDFLSSRQTQIFTTAAFVKDCNSQPSSSAVDSSSHRSAEDEEHVCSKWIKEHNWWVW